MPGANVEKKRWRFRVGWIRWRRAWAYFFVLSRFWAAGYANYSQSEDVSPADKKTWERNP